MTIYARKEICGCKPGEKVEVYGTYIEDGCIMFVVWAKSLKMWGFYKPENFSPYPFWMEDERNGKD